MVRWAFIYNRRQIPFEWVWLDSLVNFQYNEESFSFHNTVTFSLWFWAAKFYWCSMRRVLLNNWWFKIVFVPEAMGFCWYSIRISRPAHQDIGIRNSNQKFLSRKLDFQPREGVKHIGTLIPPKAAELLLLPPTICMSIADTGRKNYLQWIWNCTIRACRMLHNSIWNATIVLCLERLQAHYETYSTLNGIRVGNEKWTRSGEH